MTTAASLYEMDVAIDLNQQTSRHATHHYCSVYNLILVSDSVSRAWPDYTTTDLLNLTFNFSLC